MVGLAKNVEMPPPFYPPRRLEPGPEAAGETCVIGEPFRIVAAVLALGYLLGSIPFGLILARLGAILVQSADDIAELVDTFAGTARSTFRDSALADYAGPDDDDAAQAGLVPQIAALLGSAPVTVDELIRQCGAPAGAVQDALIDLELAGRLQRHAGGRVSLIA
eukprot:gene4425-4472_t